MHESFEQMVARLNANAFIPPPTPTGGEKRSVMAKEFKIKGGKEFNFAKATVASKYPWDEWFTGKLLILERSDVDKEGKLTPGGEKRDFEVDVDFMPSKIKTAARRRYKMVQISRRDADGVKLKDALIIKARDMMVDERAAEDLLRAEEKAARKATNEEFGDTDRGDEAAA